MAGVDCPICLQPLPLDEAVAFVDKQQLIHVSCYRPPLPSVEALPAPTSGMARMRRPRAMKKRAPEARESGRL
jgi:hypothetical protein